MRECVRAWVLEPERGEVLEKDISSQTSAEVVFIPGLSDDSSQRNRREEDHELVPERQILTSYEAEQGGSGLSQEQSGQLQLTQRTLSERGS